MPKVSGSMPVGPDFGRKGFCRESPTERFGSEVVLFQGLGRSVGAGV